MTLLTLLAVENNKTHIGIRRKYTVSSRVLDLKILSLVEKKKMLLYKTFYFDPGIYSLQKDEAFVFNIIFFYL